MNKNTSSPTAKAETMNPFQKVQLDIGYHCDWRAFAAREDHGVGMTASMHLSDIGRAVGGIETIALLLYADASERSGSGEGMLISSHACSLMEAIMSLSAHIADRTEALAKCTKESGA